MAKSVDCTLLMKCELRRTRWKEEKEKGGSVYEKGKGNDREMARKVNVKRTHVLI